MEKPLSFELAGNQFRGSHLDPVKSLECLTLIAPAIGDVLDGLQITEGQDPMEAVTSAIRSSLAQLPTLPQVAKYFEPVYEVRLSHGDADVWLSLTTQKDAIFRGKGLLYVGFLIAAVSSEYVDFLREGGLSMLADLANLYGFKMTSSSNGQSGG